MHCESSKLSELNSLTESITTFFESSCSKVLANSSLKKLDKSDAKN